MKGCLGIFAVMSIFVAGFVAAIASGETNVQSSAYITLSVDLPAGSFTADELQATANVVERRLQALDIPNASAQVIGENQITVEIKNAPADLDLQQVANTLVQTGLLEFVDFSGISDLGNWNGKTILTTEQVRIAQQHGKQAEVSLTPNPLTGQPFQTVLTGAAISAATAQTSQFGSGWVVSFSLTADGGKIFGDYTTAHIGQPLAIVLDSKVLSVPTIQSRLDTGGIITGNFTREQAKTLAAQLQTGALPLPLAIADIRAGLLRGDFGSDG